MPEIRLTENYYKEFHKRKGIYFSNAEAIEIYKATQELQKNWPSCATEVNTPPEIGMHEGLYYLKFNFNSAGKAKFRVCFGVWTNYQGRVEIVALTCRTKQELSGGNTSGTYAWKKHMSTFGKAKWNEYRRNQLRSWRIY